MRDPIMRSHAPSSPLAGASCLPLPPRLWFVLTTRDWARDVTTERADAGHRMRPCTAWLALALPVRRHGWVGEQPKSRARYLGESGGSACRVQGRPKAAAPRRPGTGTLAACHRGAVQQAPARPVASTRRRGQAGRG